MNVIRKIEKWFNDDYDEIPDRVIKELYINFPVDTDNKVQNKVNAKKIKVYKDVIDVLLKNDINNKYKIKTILYNVVRLMSTRHIGILTLNDDEFEQIGTTSHNVRDFAITKIGDDIFDVFVAAFYCKSVFDIKASKIVNVTKYNTCSDKVFVIDEDFNLTGEIITSKGYIKDKSAGYIKKSDIIKINVVGVKCDNKMIYCVMNTDKSYLKYAKLYRTDYYTHNVKESIINLDDKSFNLVAQ